MPSGSSHQGAFAPHRIPATTGGGPAASATGDADAVEVPFWAKVRPRPLRWLFSLSLDEASFAKRGFIETDPAKRLSLEATGKAFIGGYNAAIAADRLDDALQ